MELVLLASSWPPFWMKVSKFKRWLTVARRPLGAGEWSKTIVVTGLPVFQIKKIPNKYRDDHHINKYATYEVEKRKPECGDSKTKNSLINKIFTDVTLLNIFSFLCRPWKVIVGFLITCFSKEHGWFCIKISSTAKECLSVIFTKSWK